jgi:hypothetical protein
MKSFYQKWLEKNRDENVAAQQPQSSTSSVNIQQSSSLIPSTSTTLATGTQSSSPIPSTSRTLPSATMESPNNPENGSSQESSEILFENNQFIFFLKRESFQRQKRFNFQDHIFHAKIKIKDKSEPPFLKDILDFLEEGLLHLIDNLKTNYKEEDANVCFLALYQQPMINALNSGNSGIKLFLY